jgi:hypothetical protein
MILAGEKSGKLALTTIKFFSIGKLLMISGALISSPNILVEEMKFVIFNLLFEIIL